MSPLGLKMLNSPIRCPGTNNPASFHANNSAGRIVHFPVVPSLSAGAASGVGQVGMVNGVVEFRAAQEQCLDRLLT